MPIRMGLAIAQAQDIIGADLMDHRRREVAHRLGSDASA